jgi:hypothetical protein
LRYSPRNKSGGLRGSQWQEYRSRVQPNGISTRTGYWLAADLVTKLIIDVHGKWTADSAGFLASGVRFSSRHCKGASTQQL